ncbi:MAG: adenylosuccinate synthase [Candidatus Saccharimonadales bacterium]
MAVDAIIGLQRGDEGKGRFTDMLAQEHDIVARFNGGNNAGHTVVLPDGRELALHMIPSGIAHPHILNIIGNGTLLNPLKLEEEITEITAKGLDVTPKNLMISSAAHLILPHHIYEDEIREAGAGRQGSTKTGIAQVASVKALRDGARAEIIENDPDRLLCMIINGLRAQRQLRNAAGLEPINERDIAQEYVISAKKFGAFITDTVFYLNQQLRKPTPARVLAEGAQAFLLDIDHGMYPYTTSSSTTSGGVATGLGIPPHFIERVTGVVKAVQSHVGGGPFVTEVTSPDLQAQLHGSHTTIDAEVGTTTGRVRRLGFLDLPQICRSVMVNGTHDIALSKLDWVPRYGQQVPICVAYTRKGKTLKVAPDAAYKLEQSTAIYESLPTWEENIQDVRKFKNLPKTAQQYVKFIEDHVEVPIKMIGVGPNRDQVIIRS